MAGSKAGIGTAAPARPQRSEGRWTREFLVSARNACKQAGEEIGGASVAAKTLRRSRFRPTKPFEETVLGADWLSQTLEKLAKIAVPLKSECALRAKYVNVAPDQNSCDFLIREYE